MSETINLKNNQIPIFLTSNWLFLALTISLSVLFRIVLNSGIEGSDDVVYLTRAFDISNNVHQVPSYVSHLRIGLLFPLAAIFKMFGANYCSFFIWSLVASIGQLLAIFLISKILFDEKAALFISFVAAFFPLDIHLSGRAIADVPLCATLSLCVLSYLWAGRTEKKVESKLCYFLTGVLIGVAVIHKVPAIFITFFIATHLLYTRKSIVNIIYIISGGILIFILTSFYFYFVTGDLFYYFKIRTASNPFGVSSVRGVGDRYSMPVLFYPYYLFLSIQHTGLYFYIFFIGIIAYLLKRKNLYRNGIWFLFWWGVFMLLIMTFFPSKIHPLILIPKQTNYMLMFTTPFIILTGLFLHIIPNKHLKYIILTVLCTSSLFFAFFQKNTIQSHTFNTRAAIKEIEKYPRLKVVAGEYNTHYFKVHNLTQKSKIDYIPFDAIFQLNTDESPFSQNLSPNNYDEEFLKYVKAQDRLLVFYDSRTAKRQKNAYYYPGPELLNRPETGLKLIRTIEANQSFFNTVLVYFFDNATNNVIYSKLPSKIKTKLKSLSKDILNPDPAYIYLK